MKELIEKLSQPLSKEDVELRIGAATQKGFSLLLYKTARVDVKRLNESGAIWRNTHQYDSNGLLTCTISIYDQEHGFWVDRTDVGVESNTEAQKGLYSDSFKRAGFRWGIGLELYNAPFIWIRHEMEQVNGKWRPKNFFAGGLEIVDYETVDGHFTKLTINYEGKTIYRYQTSQSANKAQPAAQHQETLSDYLKRHGVDAKRFCAANQITNSEQAQELLADKSMLDEMIARFKGVAA